MDSCPKCGATSGYTYNMTIVTMRRGDWGADTDEEVEIKYTSNPKIVVCDNCGAHVRWEVAHGLNDNTKIWAK
jgi:hypothetical protein